MEILQYKKHKIAWVFVAYSVAIAASASAESTEFLGHDLLPRDIKQIDMFEMSLPNARNNANISSIPRLEKIPIGFKFQHHEISIDSGDSTVSSKEIALDSIIHSQLAAAAGEQIVYSNAQYNLANLIELLFVRPGTGVRISDDIGTELTEDCGLRRVRFAVNGGVPGGGGVFSILLNLFDGCPNFGGSTIPGSFKFISGLDNNKAIIHVIDVVFPAPTCSVSGATCISSAECPGLETCNTVVKPDSYISLQFNSSDSGWLGGNPADIGYSNDSFSFGGFGCSTALGGFPFFPHASFFTEISTQDTCDTHFLAYQAVSSIAPAAEVGAQNRWAKDLTLALGDQACEISTLEVGFRATGFQPYTVDIDFRSLGDTQGQSGTLQQFTGAGGNNIEIARFRFPPGVVLPNSPWITFRPDRDGVGIVWLDKTQAGFSEDSFRIIVDDGMGSVNWTAPKCLANGFPTFSCPQRSAAIFHVRVTCRGDAPMGTCCPPQTFPTICIGGPTPGTSCESDDECGSGQCMLNDTPCVTNSSCPQGSQCLQTCVGGIHNGLTCFTDTDCTSASDPLNTGACTGAKICDRAVCLDDVLVLDCLNGRWQAVNASVSNRCIDNPFDPPCGNHACCLPDSGERNTRFEQCLRIKDPNSPASQCGQCALSGTGCLTDSDCNAGDSCIPSDSQCLAGQFCQTNNICAPRTGIWHPDRFVGEDGFSCPLYECNFGVHDCLEEMPETICLDNFGQQNASLCPEGVACGDNNNFGICVFGGCDNASCCDRVCRQDSFCCDALWDFLCVSEAKDLCTDIPPVNDNCYCKRCNGIAISCEADDDCGLYQTGSQRTCELDTGVCGAKEITFHNPVTSWPCLPNATSCIARVNASNASATISPRDLPYCCSKFGPIDAIGSIWYQFTMPDVSGSTSARFQTCNTTDPLATDSIIQIYEIADDTNNEAACGSLVTIGCSDDAGGACGPAGRLSDTCVEGLIPGNSYYISIASPIANAGGDYLLDVEVPCPLANSLPTNDECANAEIFSPPSVSFDLNNATFSCPSVDQCPAFLTDIWYDYTPECTGTLTVETCGNGESGLPTAVAVYKVGTNDICPPDSAMNFLGCSESPCASVTVPVVSDTLNTHYLIRVGSTSTSTFAPTSTLRLTCATGDCNNNGIPDPIDIANCPIGNPNCQDCNNNGLPDECDIASCIGDPCCDDCNGNSVPDSCEPDVDGDCIPDVCDIECGNGIVEMGEECDGDGVGMGGETVTCDTDCTATSCGDSTINTTAGEQCDDADVNDNNDCTNACQNATCGDNFVWNQGSGNEACDDGNIQANDGCSPLCQIELGACCDGSACSEMTEADCSATTGNFFGFNTTCNMPDADGDGLRDECDACPNDSNKIQPGICGCGKDDSADSDGDGVLDCDDQCHGVDDSLFAPECVGAIPTVSEWGLVMMTLLLLTGIKLLRLGKHHLA